MPTATQPRRTSAPRLRHGTAYVGGVPAVALAERYGTPLYALDAEVIGANLERLRAVVGHERTELYYSCKANPSVGVLGLLRARGALLDACSPGDLLFARAAGFAPREISYTGHAMTDAELRTVAQAGVMFTADSLSQIERYARLAPGSAIGIRVNCGIEAGAPAAVRGGARSKFGIHAVQLPDAVALATRVGLTPVGLHSHLGSGLADPGPHLRLLEELLELGELLPALEWVNLGGGWGAESYDLPAFGTGADRRMRAGEARLGRPLTLRLEPGGQVVLDAGCLLTRIAEVRPAALIEGSWTPAVVGTDTSFNHVTSAVIYGKRHPIWIADRAQERATGRYEVVGNLMQAADVLARELPLPSPRPGDVLVIGDCGGYAAWRAPCFNERPRPAEVLVEDERVRLLRRAETEHDLLSYEELPVSVDVSPGHEEPVRV